jgi:hypothetical protein
MESSRVLCKQGGTGSIPVTSTNLFSDCKTLTEFISSPTPRFACTGTWFSFSDSLPTTQVWRRLSILFKMAIKTVAI